MHSAVKDLEVFLLDEGVSKRRFKPYLVDINNRLQRGRYGLVWEKQGEGKVDNLKENFPVLDEVVERYVDNGGDTNLLIEGDNLESLYILNYTHRKSIDVIYIDPPYNTGSKDFIYNDRIIGKDDTYRHSKWLSFMDKRLRLAKDLLKDEGVIFISIDDNELAQLKLLCDGVFGEDNFITIFSWISSNKDVEDLDEDEQIKALGANLGMFKSTHEYILAYRRSKLFKFDLIKKGKRYIDGRITKNGNKESVLELKKGIRCKKSDVIFKGTIGGKSEPIEILNKEGMIIKGGILQNDVKIRAQFANPRMVKEYFEGKEVVDKKGQKILEIYLTRTGLPYMRKEKKGEIVSNTLSGYGDTSKWRKHLEEILGNKGKFNYPKPFPLIMKLIDLHPNKDAKVLDFFAGSGTTGQAVLELNKEDGGGRRFILCTNNENNICEDVTYTRLNKVINGYKTSKGDEVEGLGGSLRYYRTNFIRDMVDTHNNVRALINNCRGIIQVREDCFDLSESNRIYEIVSNRDKIVVIVKEPFVLDYELDKILGYIDFKDRDIVLYTTKSDYIKDGVDVKEFPRHIVNLYNRLRKVI